MKVYSFVLQGSFCRNRNLETTTRRWFFHPSYKPRLLLYMYLKERRGNTTSVTGMHSKTQLFQLIVPLVHRHVAVKGYGTVNEFLRRFYKVLEPLSG